MLASQLGGYGAQTGSCALPHASLGASPNLAMFPGICWMCSTGSPSNREVRTYNFLSLAVPPGSCSRLSSRPLPWEFRVVALSAQQSRVFSSSHLPTLQLCRIAPSQLLAPHFGMGYLWRSNCSLGLSLTPFTLI